MRFSFLAVCLCLSFNLFAAVMEFQAVIPKQAVTNPLEVSETTLSNTLLNAVLGEMISNNLNGTAFVAKLGTKNLTAAQKIELLNPLFISKAYSVKGTETFPVKDPANFMAASFTYEIDSLKAKKLFFEIMDDLDVSKKTFYILPDINIAKELAWNDVGVTKKENFSSAIVENWKKWMSGAFKSYETIVILDQDFTAKSENMNPESVILKWNSTYTRSEINQDRKSAFFDINAQFVLNNAKTGETLTSFNYPPQKREVSITDSKKLSSTLASLVYNLLYSQESKITAAVELNKTSSGMTALEVKIVGKHGLLDITEINNFLAEQFKSITLTSELKSYAFGSSIITIKSTLPSDSLYALFAKDGGKFPLNEQKILLFNPTDKTFAIISK